MEFRTNKVLTNISSAGVVVDVPLIFFFEVQVQINIVLIL